MDVKDWTTTYVPGAVDHHKLVDLNANSNYTYMVRAFNQHGPGPWSVRHTVTTGSLGKNFEVFEYSIFMQFWIFITWILTRQKFFLQNKNRKSLSIHAAPFTKFGSVTQWIWHVSLTDFHHRQSPGTWKTWLKIPDSCPNLRKWRWVSIMSENRSRSIV